MPQRILGIDIGSWSVKAVLIESSFRNFQVERVAEIQVPAGDPERRAERQCMALTQLLEGGHFKADLTVAALPGEAATTRFVTLPFADPKKIEQTIGGELADLLPFDLADAVFDNALVKKTPDGGSVSLCAAALEPRVESHLDILKLGGADPKFLGIDVLQLFNLYSYFLRDDSSKAEAPTQPAGDANTFVGPSLDGPPDARLLVDIGHERTLVCAASEEGIGHIRVIRAGGRDVTEAIAKAYQLSFEDAEAGKHEDALVVSSRHPAPTDEAQRIAEVVSGGLQTLVRELRRTMQAIRGERRVRVARVDLLGGGARIKNLAHYLAEQLNVPVAHGMAVEQLVERHAEPARRGAFALALAFSLRPTGERPVSRIDFRKGPFAYAGQLEHLRLRVPVMLGSFAAVVLLLLVNVAVRYHLVGRQEAAIDQQFCAITKTVVGREICEPRVAISVLRQPASELGNFKLPERSAFKVAAELSHLVPSEPAELAEQLLFTEMDITPERARVSGEAPSFDAVDQLVAAYGANTCFFEINKGKLRKKSSGQGVEFQLAMRLRCSQ